MLQTLKKKSKKIVLIKLAIRDFIKYQLWVYLIVIASVILCSWVFNRWIQGIMFCVAHIFIRNAFDKQFHLNKTAYCLSLTLAIIWFAIPITLPFTISLLSSIPIAFIICFIGFIAQDRMEIYLQNKDLEHEFKAITEELNKYKQIDIYKMTKEELRQYGASQKLSEVQIDILCMRVFDHLKISEICKYANYGRTTIKYHLGQIKQKLKLTTF